MDSSANNHEDSVIDKEKLRKQETAYMATNPQIVLKNGRFNE